MVCVDSVLQLHIVKVVATIINRCFFMGRFLCQKPKDKSLYRGYREYRKYRKALSFEPLRPIRDYVNP